MGLVSRFDTSGFARELAEIGDLVAANLTTSHNFDLGDRGGVDGEGTFDADPRGDLADREGGGDTAAAALDDNAFEDLVSFLLVLDDTDVDLDGVAGGELRDIRAELTGSNFIDNIVVHFDYSFRVGFVEQCTFHK